jgi:hypothetical protein
MKRFSSEVRIVPILAYASGTADRKGKVIDMKGFDSVCVVVQFATIAASAVTDIYLQEADAASDADTLTSGADLAGTSQTVAADDDDECKYIDVVKPLKRFLQLNVNKDATNACAESAVAYLYNADEVPVTHAEGTGTSGGVDIVEGEAFLSPIAGTK